VTRVGPAFARLGPGASTAATRSSGAGGFPRDLVRDGWQAAGSSSRRYSAGCPPVPDAAAGGYADGGIRAGRRRRQEDGRDGPRVATTRRQTAACASPRTPCTGTAAAAPSGVSAAPGRGPPAAGYAPTPLAAPRSRGRTNPPLPASSRRARRRCHRAHRCSFAPARGTPRGFGKRSREGRPGTDTLTVSSRTTPRNRNTGKTSPLTLNDANQPRHAHG
jgi:hypothetical protein